MTTVQPAFVPASPDYIHLGVHSMQRPDYTIKVWQGADPRFPLHKMGGMDLASVTSFQTSKSLDDISGTFTIGFKDAKGAANNISAMDVVDIAVTAPNGQKQTILRGVVDSDVDSGSADTQSSEEDGTVTGRCLAKYLQTTNTFRPVWDANTNLPTSLIFGYGASFPGVIGLINPRDIFAYLYTHFIVGERNVVGESGIPNARYWLNGPYRDGKGHTLAGPRFGRIPGLHIPYIQFDESDMGSALKQFEILGFTEAWVDELGNVVYRRPQWDAGYTYFIPTEMIKSWSFSSSDVELNTYVEVVPTGAAGINAAFAQANMTGRAPIPKTYEVNLKYHAEPDFIIDTDKRGRVTAKGLKNYWYQRQRKYGLRAMQVTSPLINTPYQAQAQAEGLLRFYDCFSKTATITIPGDPRIRLGTNCRIKGELRGRAIDRTYYINAVAHEYTEGSHYDTTLTLTHGRDPWDPKWTEIALPSAVALNSSVPNNAGVLQPGASGTGPGAAQFKAAAGQLGVGGQAQRSPMSGQGYANLFGQCSAVSTSRVDQGCDWAGIRGPIGAVDSGVITYVSPFGAGPGSEGGFGASIVQQLDGSGWYVYYGCETGASIFANIKKGMHVQAGQTLMEGIPAGSLEFGFAQNAGPPLPLTPYPPGANHDIATRGGAGFANFVSGTKSY
jgi:hypothetical protein